MKLIKQSLIASAIALSMSNAASAATLNITDGILMGATGVNVGGTLYDVTFGDGNFADGITAFTTLDSATLASQALLDQVLLGDYDTLAKNTNGCTSSSSCFIYTTYYKNSTSISVALAANYVVESNDLPRNSSSRFLTDTKSSGDTLAFWKVTVPAATAVPEPEAYAMMLAGLGLVGFAARRQQKAA